MKQSFSIVIPTYHRVESLKRLFASLAKENISATDIIVVEQGENHGNILTNAAKKSG